MRRAELPGTKRIAVESGKRGLRELSVVPPSHRCGLRLVGVEQWASGGMERSLGDEESCGRTQEQVRGDE
jgi:hypothetical protein